VVALIIVLPVSQPVCLVWSILSRLGYLYGSSLCLDYFHYVWQKRQQKAITSAAKTDAIVFSVFPTEIQDRLLGNEDDKKDGKTSICNVPESSKFRLSLKIKRLRYSLSSTIVGHHFLLAMRWG
jgi:hypothetical protein